MKKTIEDILKEYTPKLMTYAGVNGTGLGKCGDVPCIKIFVSALSDDIRQKIPETLEGYPVKIEKAGPFKAYE